jgi:hypothetical protein
VYTTTGSANDPRTVNLALPATATAGTYTAQVLVFDGPSGRLESSCEAAFTVTGGGGGCSISCNAAVPTTAQVGQTVSFTGSATPSGSCDPVEFFWFPEQGYSTATIQAQNGSWVYNAPGTYTWLFVVTGANGGRCERTGTITVTGGGGSATTTWIPVVSRASGANNSIWRTDVGIFNPGTATANVTINIYVSTGTLTRTVTIGAGGQRVIGDIVGWFDPSLNTSAAVSIVSTQILVVTSRTYNRFAAGAPCFPGGTLGQALGGWLTAHGLSAGQSGWLPHMVETSSFRTNIGYTNTGSTPAGLTVRLYNGNGTQVGTYTVNLNPGQWKQASQPFRTIGGQTNLQGGSARITVTSGSGVVVYGSVIDNITNDPTTITMVR